jgi:hypothetical protein
MFITALARLKDIEERESAARMCSRILKAGNHDTLSHSVLVPELTGTMWILFCASLVVVEPGSMVWFPSSHAYSAVTQLFPPMRCRRIVGIVNSIVLELVSDCLHVQLMFLMNCRPSVSLVICADMANQCDLMRWLTQGDRSDISLFSQLLITVNGTEPPI